MRTHKNALAITEVLLVFPAALFMFALFVRNIQPQQFEPAHTAQRIVMWYAERPHIGLWFLLIALPFTAFVTGCATLVESWQSEPELRAAVRRTLDIARAHLVPLIVVTATLTAGGILAVVAVHVLTD